MEVQIGDMAVEVELTDRQKARLAAGQSVTVNLYPDPDHREYTVEDMGFSPGPPFTNDDYQQPRVVRRRADGHRVHVDSIKHPNPAVDDKKFAAQASGGFHYKGTAADLNYSFKGTDPELVKLYTGIDPELDLEFDPVDKPSHYAEGRRYEPIDVIEDWELGMHLGNATKYISRAGRKGDELEDLKKARWYIERRISLLERTKDD